MIACAFFISTLKMWKEVNKLFYQVKMLVMDYLFKFCLFNLLSFHLLESADDGQV